MLRRLHARLTYANVMATVAVFIALGGSSYAALRITGKNVPKNALTGADIKNLTGKDVRNNSLTGADVRNLTSADVANGRLLAEDFAPGQLPSGEKGERGPEGAPATKLFAYVAFNSPSSYAIEYGSGAIQVTNQNSGRIDVRFNRTVHGCATHITPGNPAPHDDDLDVLAIPSVHVDPDEIPGSEDDVIRVLLRRANGDPTDTSFLITLFC
jgi:hypothetical protein